MASSRRMDALVAATAQGSSRHDWHPSWFGGDPASSQTRYPSPHIRIGALEAEGLLLHDWRSYREIRELADALLANGVEVCDLPANVDLAAVYSHLEGDSVRGIPGLLTQLIEGWAEGAAYGGALVIAITADGRPSSEPIDTNSIESIISWEIVDRWSCWPYRRRGLGSPVDYWVLSGSHLQIERASQIVHPSRVAVMPGRWMPRRWRDLFDGWWPSRLELLDRQRNNLHDGMAKLGKLLTRSSQDVIALAEMSEMIEEWGPGYMKDRAKVMADTLESDGVLFLDGGIKSETAGGGAGRDADKFQSVARPLSGADAVAKIQHDDWRRGSGMPGVVADGDQSVGLNGGAESGPWRAWDVKCDGEFKSTLLGAINWGLALIFASKNGPTGGKVPETWTVKRKPLAEPDRKLEAEIDEIETRTDAAAKQAGTLADKEIRQWRNVDGKHGRVRVEAASMLPEPGANEVEAAIAAQAGGVPAGGDVQRQALNGAQIQALFDLSVAVTTGKIPADVARWLVDLAVPGLDTAGVTQAMAIAQAWTNPKAPPEPVAAPTQAGAEVARAVVDAFELRLLDRRADAASFDPWVAAICRRDDWSHDSAGVFVVVPDGLARQFPYKPNDTSPPHVTLLYIGPTSYDQITEVREVVAKTALELEVLPCRARFGELGYFEQSDGRRVAWVAVEFEPALDEYHVALREALMAEGVMVQHRDGPWVSHATLAYLEPGEEFEGRVPVGEWTVERFEVWHGEQR